MGRFGSYSGTWRPLWLALLVVGLLSGCDPASTALEATGPGALAVIAVFSASDSVPMVEVRGFDVPVVGARSSLEVRRANQTLDVEGRRLDREPGWCAQFPMESAVGSVVCHVYSVELRPGDSVHFEVSVDRAEAARGMTRLPGAFAVTSGQVSPGPDGSALDIAWTASEGAASYTVAVYDDALCDPDIACPVLGVAHVSGTEALVRFSPPSNDNARLFATVTALDPNLAAFVTSGVPGGTFAKLPISSVEGGLGVVGSQTPGDPRRLYLEIPR